MSEQEREAPQRGALHPFKSKELELAGKTEKDLVHRTFNTFIDPSL